MGLFRYSFKYQRKYLAFCLFCALILVLLEVCIFRDDGFLMQLIICVIVVVLFILFAFLNIYIKAYKAFKVLGEKGICDELIEVYKKGNKRMCVTNHIVLASYYMNLNRTYEAQQELYLASLGKMSSDFIKAYYLDILIGVNIIQKRFDEAAKIYGDNAQAIENYCGSHKDGVCVSLYGLGAVLCAKQGNFDEATAMLDKTEPAIQREKELVFNKNIFLMEINLIKGDVQTADRIKQDMLSDLETFRGFQFRSSKMMYTNRIKDAQLRYDPRAQMQ